MKRKFTKYPSSYIQASAKSRRAWKQFNGEPTSDEAVKLAEDGGLELWQPLTFEGAVKLARIGSRIDNHGGIDWDAVGRWDTSAEGQGSRFFDIYSKMAPLYIFINRSDPHEKYQFWPGSLAGKNDLLADIRDRVLSGSALDEFFEEHPKFAECLNVYEDVDACSDTKYAADMSNYL